MLPDRKHPTYKAFIAAKTCAEKLTILLTFFEETLEPHYRVAKLRSDSGRPGLKTPFYGQLYEEYVNFMWMLGDYKVYFQQTHPTEKSYLNRWEERMEFLLEDMEFFIVNHWNGVTCWMWCATERILRDGFAEPLRTWKRTKAFKEELGVKAECM